MLTVVTLSDTFTFKKGRRSKISVSGKGICMRYVVADFEMFPICTNGGMEYAYFWDMPEYRKELHFCHWFVGGGTQELRTPLFLAPTRRPADMSAERVEYYRKRLQEENTFPRAIALFLNGGVALLLDGHHKAAACAMEGKRVRTLVIYRMDAQPDGVCRAETAAADGVRLYLQQDNGAKVPVALCDGQNNVLGRFSCLEEMKKNRLYIEPVKIPAWGRVPDELRTERFFDYPSVSNLESIGELKPNEIRRMIEEQKVKPRGEHHMGVIHLLRTYAGMFPDSKWISPAERAWLSRPDDQFEDYGYEVERPNRK